MAYFDFRFRQSSLGKNHTGGIFIRLVHKNTARCITTPFKVYPHEWDDKQHHIILPSSPESDRYVYLQQVIIELEKERERLNAIIAKFDSRDRLYTVVEVSDYYRDAISTVLIEPYSKKLSAQLTEEGKHRTARAYVTIMRDLIEFTGNKNITFNHLTEETIKRYEDYMKKEGKTLNTISFYMRNLRAIYNKAINDKLILGQWEDPFRSVYTGVDFKGTKNT